MSLQLNDPGSDKYKEFYGPNNVQMPLLIGEGRTPLSVVGLMSRYLEVLKLHSSAPELKPAYALLAEAWGNNYFDTGDLAARHSDGRMKVAPDASYLLLITHETRLVNGAVDLSEGYADLAGYEFSKANVNEYCGMALDRSDAKMNPVWLALAGGDKTLLDEFVDARFAQEKERFRYDGKMMGVYAPPVPKEGVTGRLWTVFRLGVNIYGSWAYGNLHLDLSFGSDDCGRLVGVTLEAQRAAAVATVNHELEQRLTR